MSGHCLPPTYISHSRRPCCPQDMNEIREQMKQKELIKEAENKRKGNICSAS